MSAEDLGVRQKAQVVEKRNTCSDKAIIPEHVFYCQISFGLCFADQYLLKRAAPCQ
jgi:hypothetical protein